MGFLQGPVVCPRVRTKQEGFPNRPINISPRFVRLHRSEFLGFEKIDCSKTKVQFHSPKIRKCQTVHCSFRSSSDGNGSTAENFNSNDQDYINSSVIEAVEVKSGADGFMIKIRGGLLLTCVHTNPQVRTRPDYASHPVTVLKMEDETGLLLPIIVLEMPDMMLLAAIGNIRMIGSNAENLSFDLRPSDAINIAVRCKVPIQVNKALAYSNGMRVVESAKNYPRNPATDGLLFTELDFPCSQPCNETEEFNFVCNMQKAAKEERYEDAARWRDELRQFRARKNKT